MTETDRYSTGGSSDRYHTEPVKAINPATPDQIDVALTYYRQHTGLLARAEMESAANSKRNFHTLAEINALTAAGVQVRR